LFSQGLALIFAIDFNPIVISTFCFNPTLQVHPITFFNRFRPMSRLDFPAVGVFRAFFVLNPSTHPPRFLLAEKSMRTACVIFV
jgi:hypothetical protein